MNKIVTTLKHSTRAFVVAALIGTSGAAVVATPAAAQPSFGFSIELGGDYSVRSGKRYYKKCLSDRQLIRALRDEGYRDIEITRRLKGDRVEVTARRRGDWWVLRIDLCTGEVYDVKRAKGYDYDVEIKRPGIGLKFQFGN